MKGYCLAQKGAMPQSHLVRDHASLGWSSCHRNHSEAQMAVMMLDMQA